VYCKHVVAIKSVIVICFSIIIVCESSCTGRVPQPGLDKNRVKNADFFINLQTNLLIELNFWKKKGRKQKLSDIAKEKGVESYRCYLSM